MNDDRLLLTETMQEGFAAFEKIVDHHADGLFRNGVLQAMVVAQDAECRTIWAKFCGTGDIGEFARWLKERAEMT